jgi:hypothetical protein
MKAVVAFQSDAFVVGDHLVHSNLGPKVLAVLQCHDLVVGDDLQLGAETLALASALVVRVVVTDVQAENVTRRDASAFLDRLPVCSKHAHMIYRAEGASPLLLAGLLRCTRCGDPCQLESSGKLDPSGQPYRYYNCRRFCRSGKGTCAGYRIAVDTLDKAVLTHIAEHVFTEARCQEILRDFVEDQGVLRQKTAEQRRLHERERDELGKRLER